MTIYSELRIASTSDVHLGHPKTSAKHIAANYMAAFPHNAKTAALDILIIAGDFFDHLLNFPNEDVPEIISLIVYILRLCKKYDIELMVLEGTPSHDRKQSKNFVEFNERLAIGCSLSYVDDLEVRIFPKLGISVLFVPDEWSDSADKTLGACYDAIATKGLSKVDYAVMHGQFEYQLPPVVKAQKHNSDAYLSLVDKLIFIGHVHQFSRKDRIIAQGSFDRYSHGDEKPKGHVRAIVRSNDDYEIEFIENAGAKIFKTVDCRDMALEDAHKVINKVAIELVEQSYIRVMAKAGDAILNATAHYEKDYPHLQWDFVVKKDAADAVMKDIAVPQDEYVPVAITRDNISRMVEDSLLAKGLTNDVVLRAMQKLKELT